MKDYNNSQLDYFSKRFSSPVCPQMTSEISIPPLNNIQDLESRNELNRYKINDRKSPSQSNLFNENGRPDKISTRETYMRKRNKIFVNKSRSRTVRGSLKVIQNIKFKSVLKTINK